MDVQEHKPTWPHLDLNPALSQHARQRAQSIQNKIADNITTFAGSMAFVYIHIIWFAAWIGFGVESYPYGLLTMIVSLEAIFLSTFILINQNLETRVSERRSHLDLQLNMLSEQENTKMITILRAIAEKVGADLSHDPHLEALSEETLPEKLAEQIEAKRE